MSASRGPIRVAVAGARGRMGSLVVQGVVQSRDLQLVAAFDVVNIGGPAGGVAIAPPAALEMALRRTGAQVLIDFTRAEAAVSNVRGAVRAGVSPVVGTTGFSEAQRGRIGRLVGRRVAAVVSPNFSVGVNLLWRLEEMVLGALPEADVEVVEVHHQGKRDAPSGTALEMARIAQGAGRSPVVYGRRGVTVRRREVGVHALRGGDVVGDHTLLVMGEGERLELVHRSHSRLAFVHGALRAARWVVRARPGVHTMREVLGL